MIYPPNANVPHEPVPVKVAIGLAFVVAAAGLGVSTLVERVDQDKVEEFVIDKLQQETAHTVLEQSPYKIFAEDGGASANIIHVKDVFDRVSEDGEDLVCADYSAARFRDPTKFFTIPNVIRPQVVCVAASGPDLSVK